MLKNKTFQFNLKSVDEDNYTIRGIFSTGSVDRHNEIVDQSSWILSPYMQNPVVLFAHDHSQPAIGKMIDLQVTSEGLEGTIQFAVAEYEFAKTIWNLYKGGFMSAFSAGFASEEQETNGDGVVILKKNTLFEMSAVNVPANAEALAKAKASGIDISALEKEGRVLSTKNRNIIQSAYDALGDVLAIGDKEDDKKSTNNDTENGRGVSRVGDRKKLAMSACNKAIRALYREQRKFTN